MILLPATAFQANRSAAAIRCAAAGRRAVAWTVSIWTCDASPGTRPRGGRHGTPRGLPDKVRADSIAAMRTTQTTRVPERATRRGNGRSNSMARAEGVSASTVGRIWREHGLSRTASNRFNSPIRQTDLSKTLDDIVGPLPEPSRTRDGVELRREEPDSGFGSHAAERLPAAPRERPHDETHDYVRHGTTTLFAALGTLDGKVIGTCMPRHRTTGVDQVMQLIDVPNAGGQRAFT